MWMAVVRKARKTKYLRDGNSPFELIPFTIFNGLLASGGRAFVDPVQPIFTKVVEFFLPLG